MMIQQLKVKLVKTNVLNTKLFESCGGLEMSGQIWSWTTEASPQLPTCTQMHDARIVPPICLSFVVWLAVHRQIWNCVLCGAAGFRWSLR